jgi:hypothetical protein
MVMDHFMVTSMHECSHAVASFALKMPVHSVEVHGDGSGTFRASPQSSMPTEGDARRVCYDELCSDWKKDGGPANRSWLFRTAVMQTTPSFGVSKICGIDPIGHESDLADTRALVGARSLDDAAHRAFMTRVVDGAISIINMHHESILALAQRLYVTRYLEGEQIRGVLRSTPGGRELLGEREMVVHVREGDVYGKDSRGNMAIVGRIAPSGSGYVAFNRKGRRVGEFADYGMAARARPGL